MIVYGFGVLRVQAIYAGNHPLNTASRNFMQHLGFRYTHDEYYPPIKLLEPSYMLSKSDAAFGAPPIP